MTWWLRRVIGVVALVFVAGFLVGGGIVVAKQVISDSKLPAGPDEIE